jgi:hypothetical protein
MTDPRPDLLTTFDVRCPYCRHANRLRISNVSADSLTRIGRTNFRELVTCDSEAGGCDSDFAIQVEATVVFDVKTVALAGVGLEVEPAPDSDGEPTVAALMAHPAPADFRVWTLKTKGENEPGGGETEHFNAAQLAEMVPRAGRPLAALALTMRGGDSFEFTSVEGLITYHFTCYEPAEPPATAAT